MNISPQFVGREFEIALFEKCFTSILPENRGKTIYENLPQILNFYGESGVGKTTLANELMIRATKIYPDFFFINLFDKTNRNAASTQFLNAVTQFIKKQKFSPNLGLNLISYKSAKNERQFKNNLHSATFNLQQIAELKPIVLLADLDTTDFYYFLSETFYQGIYGYSEVPPILSIVLTRKSISKEFTFFEFGEKLFIAKELLPLSFEESKLFLNGFFAQFSDNYLQRIYNYSKGKPAQLQFLIDLVKDKKIPAETVLNELLHNEGKVLGELKVTLAENQNLEHNVIAVMTHNLNNKFGALRNDFDSLKKIIQQGIQGEFAEEILNSFYKKLDEATNTFNNTYRILEKRSIAKQATSMKIFLEEIKNEYLNKDFLIEIVMERDEIIAEIDTSAMKELFQNLIQNAINHGFADKKREYKIVIACYETTQKGEKYILINYKNNGKAFNKRFSFDEYKKLAGKSTTSTGAGIGGYWIKKVVDLHKGEWNAINLYDNSLDFPIEMEFLLPQKQF